MSTEPSVRIYERPNLNKPALITGWIEDAGGLGASTADYIIGKLGCREFAEIMPEGFFPMAGVVVADNVAQFPESKFYASEKHDLVIFKSNMPRGEWHRFLNAVVEVAQEDCGVSEIYSLGAMVTYAAHTTPRVLISVVNSNELKVRLEPYDVVSNTDYETPPGQKPTLNSYLIWVAKRRGIPAANLWIPVPYYLVPLDDPRARKKLVDFVNTRFNLSIDTADLDDEIADQNRRISQLFQKSPEVEGYVGKLEAGEGLNAEEGEKLAREMAEFLKK